MYLFQDHLEQFQILIFHLGLLGNCLCCRFLKKFDLSSWILFESVVVSFQCFPSWEMWLQWSWVVMSKVIHVPEMIPRFGIVLLLLEGQARNSTKCVKWALSFLLLCFCENHLCDIRILQIVLMCENDQISMSWVYGLPLHNKWLLNNSKKLLLLTVIQYKCIYYYYYYDY